jgi:hypothetical protein
MPNDGVIGAYDGQSLVIKIIICSSVSLTVYNALELVVLILLVFKAYRGLYFWSLFVTTIGLLPYSIGFSLKLLGVNKWAGVVLLSVGWYVIVTGQAVVLWSRLHLVLQGERGPQILKATIWMIIGNAIVLHISTTVMTFGVNGKLTSAAFVRAYNIIEKVQMTGFL